MSQSQREKIRTLGGEHSYKWRAYMSSALTNLPEERRTELCERLERLYLEVFHPLDIFLYLPHIWSDPAHHAEIDPEDVHILDRLRIAESDFIVVCADDPSFGVGQELEMAQAMGIPIVCYHGYHTRVSRMLSGSFGFHMPPGENQRYPSRSLIKYENFDDLCRKLRTRVNELTDRLEVIGATSDSVPDFSRTLRRIMEEESYSDEDLASASGMSVGVVRHLLSDRDYVIGRLRRWDLPEFNTRLEMTKYINPGLWVLGRLAEALKVDISRFVELESMSAEVAQKRTVRSKIEVAVGSVARRSDLKFSQYEELCSNGELLAAARSGRNVNLEQAVERAARQLGWLGKEGED